MHMEQLVVHQRKCLCRRVWDSLAYVLWRICHTSSTVSRREGFMNARSNSRPQAGSHTSCGPCLNWRAARAGRSNSTCRYGRSPCFHTPTWVKHASVKSGGLGARKACLSAGGVAARARRPRIVATWSSRSSRNARSRPRSAGCMHGRARVATSSTHDCGGTRAFVLPESLAQSRLTEPLRSDARVLRECAID